MFKLVFIDTDELLKTIKKNQPLNCTELTKAMGLEPSKANIIRVYNKVSRLAMDGIIRSKRCGGSRVVWINLKDD